MGLMSLAGCRIKTQLMSIFTTKKVYKFFSRQNRIQKDLPSCQLGLILKRAEDYHLSVQCLGYVVSGFPLGPLPKTMLNIFGRKKN